MISHHQNDFWRIVAHVKLKTGVMAAENSAGITAINDILKYIIKQKIDILNLNNILQYYRCTVFFIKWMKPRWEQNTFQNH